ncbi:MAG TPA: TetR/AcrR family transcriptional regulator, partial [Pseudonocardiaceae bacterium]|nr:TetR/AcrR family transcriptional regulator [Pseudonocardiaceae bacterium]
MSEGSPRREELLAKAYDYVLAHGIGDLSLRPLAAAIDSSPRVLLYLFGSKDGLVRALLARAREAELAFLHGRRPETADLAAVVRTTWTWLSSAELRPLLNLWLEAYAKSLVAPTGPWAEFAQDTVTDWLAMLAAAQPPAHRDTEAGITERTIALATLRGAMLDLLATDDL